MNPGSFKDDTAPKSHRSQPDWSPPTQGHPAHLQPDWSPQTWMQSPLSSCIHPQVFVTPFIQKMRSPPGLPLCSARPFLKVPQVGRTEHYCSLKRQEDIKEGPSGRNTWRADAPESHSDPRDVFQRWGLPRRCWRVSLALTRAYSNFSDQATQQPACGQSSPSSWAELSSCSAAAIRINKIFIIDVWAGLV